MRRYCKMFSPCAFSAAFLSMFLAHSPIAARTFGDHALTSARSVVGEKEALFSAVGMIECRSANGQVQTSNGFLIGSRTTMIANRQALGGLTSLSSGDLCKANFYAPDGTLRDSVDVDRMIALDDGRSSSDLVLFTLRRASLYAKAPLGYQAGSDPVRLDRHPIYMVTMVAQPSERRKVRSDGVAYKLSADVARQRGAPGRVVMATDYDSVSASRGSPVFDASGKVVGLHNGSYCPMNGNAFDKDQCFNEFVIIGHAEHRMIAAASR